MSDKSHHLVHRIGCTVVDVQIVVHHDRAATEDHVRPIALVFPHPLGLKDGLLCPGQDQRRIRQVQQGSSQLSQELYLTHTAEACDSVSQPLLPCRSSRAELARMPKSGND